MTQTRHPIDHFTTLFTALLEGSSPLNAEDLLDSRPDFLLPGKHTRRHQTPLFDASVATIKRLTDLCGFAIEGDTFDSPLDDGAQFRLVLFDHHNIMRAF